MPNEANSQRMSQPDGRERGTTYRLPGPGDSSPSAGDSSHKGDSLHKRPMDSSHKLEEISEEELTNVRKYPAEPNRPYQAYTTKEQL